MQFAAKGGRSSWTSAGCGRPRSGVPLAELSADGDLFLVGSTFQGIVELSLKSILFRRDYLRNLSDLREITDDCRRSVYFPKIRRKN